MSTSHTPGEAQKAWWLGPCGHEWQAVVHSRSGGCGCPYRKISSPVRRSGC
ncbi:zinc-ribbon domain-containing protein [Kitasatospora sp. NPDC058243]|uniref:zinc-ribbon domain-containing protein n=1 Tax=Kitasatospora sp. NPDC058243 TaxID=3346397 RepID=UPI0036D7A56D